MVAAAAATFIGCASTGTFNSLSSAGSSSNNAGSGSGTGSVGTLRLSFDANTLPAGVDSVQVVFRDTSGNQVGKVVEVPLEGTQFVVPVPAGAVLAEVDYLQNGGLALFQSFHLLTQENISLRVEASDLSDPDKPNLQPVGPSSSRWSTAINPAEIRLSTTGNPGFDNSPSPVAKFPVRGVGYSPAPVGFSNEDGPGFGDLFWDGFYIQGAGDLLDWSKVWKRDLENIRTRFNSIRTYSLIAEHTDSNGQFTNPATTRTHNKFLDACWNNGHEPVYVIVGVPLPSDCFIANGNAANRANFERVLASTVDQLKDHPAVMGFTIFNELGGGNSWGGNPADSQFYWGQVQKYSSQVKAAAPTKLCGFAYFDAPGDVNSANTAGLLQQFGGSLDFWGVNSFQGTVIAPTLAPYKNLGSATKPVLFTEFAVPATSHRDKTICSGDFPTQAGVNSIFADDTTIQTAATAMQNVIPLAVNDNIVGGMFYFEWSDEFWKQPSQAGCYTNSKNTQEGGKVAAIGQMPNGFNDEEGFGLHAIQLGNRAATAIFDPFNPNAATANNVPDILTPRTPLLDAVSGAYGKIR